MMEAGKKEPKPVESGSLMIPWHGGDVLFLFLLWFTLTLLCVRGVLLFSETPTSDTAFTASVTTEHPLSRLILQSRTQGQAMPILLVAFLSAVVLAPLTEEFLFRLLLQGWLQKWLQNEVRIGNITAGILAISVVSLGFASLHGGQHPPQSTETLFYGILGLTVGNFLTLCLGVAYLCKKYRLPLPLVFGIKRTQLCPDLFAGLAYFFSVGIVILALSSTLREHYPNASTDPIPLFIFSLALGLLYFTRGRLLPAITLHVCLNGFSFAVLVCSIF